MRWTWHRVNTDKCMLDLIRVPKSRSETLRFRSLCTCPTWRASLTSPTPSLAEAWNQLPPASRQHSRRSCCCQHFPSSGWQYLFHSLLRLSVRGTAWDGMKEATSSLMSTLIPPSQSNKIYSDKCLAGASYKFYVDARQCMGKLGLLKLFFLLSTRVGR